jgi:hypothetical protein
MGSVEILDASGRPFPERSRIVSMLAGGLPHDAADALTPELAAWTPWLGSPDVELNPYRDRIVSRVRDLVRNDGWASGGVTRILDNAIGANFRLVSKPDYRALAHLSSNPAFDSGMGRRIRPRARLMLARMGERRCTLLRRAAQSDRIADIPPCISSQARGRRRAGNTSLVARTRRARSREVCNGRAVDRPGPPEQSLHDVRSTVHAWRRGARHARGGSRLLDSRGASIGLVRWPEDHDLATCRA